jgi:hypothetical protein
MPVVLRQTPDDGRQPMLDMCVHSLCHSLVFVPAGHVAHPPSLLFSRSKDELGAVRSLRWGLWFGMKGSRVVHQEASRFTLIAIVAHSLHEYKLPTEEITYKHFTTSKFSARSNNFNHLYALRSTL